MSDNNNNDPNELDDAFDVEEDFEDVNIDDEAFDEADFSEDVDGDVEYSDEDFAEEEWQDDEEVAAAMAADPNNKKLYRGGKEKKSFLSFNTIVIIGAVIVGGGVLAFTVLNKSQEVAAAKSNIFRSMLNIGEIMDGRIFGDKEEAPAPTDNAAGTPAEGTDANGGFLNNPDQLATTDANPPQPSPIAPEESAAPNEPLTPLPEDGQVPRSPDAAVPVSPETPVIVEPETADGNKAEELLKEAIANREDVSPAVVPANPADAAAAPAVPATPEVIAEPAPAAPVEVPAEIPSPVPAAVEAPVPAAPAPVVVDTETKENVKALEAKLDQVLNRMSSLESDISTLKQSGSSTGSSGLKEIEQSVQALKQDLNEIKSRPAQVVEKTVVEKIVQAAPADAAEEPKPVPVKKKAAPKKAPAAAKAPASSAGRWELRAAQPGKAWVSKPGERDMRGVQVGETLPGIGQITAILYQNGRWTVQGTQGQINQ